MIVQVWKELDFPQIKSWNNQMWNRKEQLGGNNQLQIRTTEWIEQAIEMEDSVSKRYCDRKGGSRFQKGNHTTNPHNFSCLQAAAAHKSISNKLFIPHTLNILSFHYQ